MTISNRLLPTSNRRTFLKASGISIALCGLESIAPAVTEPGNNNAAEPMRMVYMLSGLGVHPEAFFPVDYGRDYTLSPTLSPIEKIRDNVTVFSHMDHPHISSGHGAMQSALSGVKIGNGPQVGSFVSVDQVAADHVSYTTRFPSVHVSVGGAQDCSWTKSGIKVREDSLSGLFAKLFVNNQEKANKERELQLQEQGSLLDLVREQAAAFKRKISLPDQNKLDEYFTAIREAEVKLQGQKKWLNVDKPKVENPTEGHPHGDMDYNFLAPLMMDIICLAIQSDSSRVFTAGFGMHNRIIELDGINTGYHSLSHHGKDPDKIRQLMIIDRFYIAQYVRLIQKLKDIKTSKGTMIDQTMVMFGSSMADASKHSNRNLPILLAGGGFKHGVHLDCQVKGNQTPLNNLFTTMLRRFGVGTERFLNATAAFDLA